MVLNTRSLAAIVALGSALVACGGEPAPAGSAALVATTGIWADVASRVACRDGGDPAVVPALIPDGADPHTFEPSLRDRRTLEHAMVVIANGAGLEGATADLLGAARRSGTRVVELADVVGTIDGDPHVWQDPTVVAAALDAIADAAVATGGDAAAIAACTADYRAQLVALDADIAAMIAAIPAERRTLVTSHDSLAYFARRYGLEIVGTVIPATNTLAESSAAQLAALADVIADRGVPAVFTDRFESSTEAEALANRLGVRVVPLVTDALTDEPGGETYLAMMRSNAAAISGALAP